ncbi:hypothetical protein [Bradyrhizobium sp. SZCCHNR1093]|uniref:hypothetical protein n=1 Tax=Bradyrhizobium sp. SZCCHNR1093 TaxID=3057368 RepID=UPI0028E4D1A3|nr:hypothetical protein [Bradyrhizobium sp. SZCCHNR1093]
MTCVAALANTDGSISAERNPETGVVRLTVRGKSDTSINLTVAERHDFIWQASPHNKRSYQGPPA